MSNIQVTNSDPGEGSALASDNFVAVYGGKSLLDMFYPVGSYYETSDTTFDPNTAWGGVWVEDAAGRVTVSRNSGTFATVGDTGGEEKHSHEYGFQYAGYWRDTVLEGATKVGLFAYNHSNVMSLSGWGTHVDNEALNININNGDGQRSVTSGLYRMTANTKYEPTLQPYIVVARWHRIA